MKAKFSLSFVAPLGAMLIGLFAAAPATAAEQRVLMLLSAGEPENQGFMLVLANQMRGQDKPVRLLLCGPAGDLALANPPPAIMTPVTPNGQSPRVLLEGFMKRGGSVEVCAIYLPNRKMQTNDLIEGVKVANPAAMATEMLEANVRVIGR